MNRGKYVKDFVNDYCVLDTETTGLDPKKCKMIEIAILKVRNGQVIDEYQTLINPHRKINNFIQNLTGISNELLVDAPSFEEVSDSIFDFIGDDFLVGHNVSFDLRFLSQESQREFNNFYTDTRHISRKVIPNLDHYRLQDLCSYYDIKPGTHRAMTDTKATYLVYEKLKDSFNQLGIDKKTLFK